jgi:hypothetical protein
MLADDENLNGGKLLLNKLGHFQAIHARHRDVEEYDVRLKFSYFAYRVSPISRLANNFDVRLGMENLADAATDALVVIYHEHTKYVSKHNISSSRAITTMRSSPERRFG